MPVVNRGRRRRPGDEEHGGSRGEGHGKEECVSFSGHFGWSPFELFFAEEESRCDLVQVAIGHWSYDHGSHTASATAFESRRSVAEQEVTGIGAEPDGDE